MILPCFSSDPTVENKSNLTSTMNLTISTDGKHHKSEFFFIYGQIDHRVIIHTVFLVLFIIELCKKWRENISPW